MRSWSSFLRAEWDRVAGWALIALGALAIFLAYRGVADATLVAQQLSYIASGGFGGLLLVAVGVGLLVSADVHDEWRKLDRIAELLEVRDDPQSERGTATVIVVAIATAIAAVLVVVGWSQSADAVGYDDALGGTGWSAAGTAVGTAAVAAWLFALRARLHGRKRLVFAKVAPPAAPTPIPNERVAVAKGGRRYHRPDCPVVASVKTRLVARVPAGLEPCGLCHR